MDSARGNELIITVAQVLAADYRQAHVNSDSTDVCQTIGFVVQPMSGNQSVEVFHREPALADEKLLAWLDNYLQTLASVGLAAELIQTDEPYLKVKRK